MTRHIINPQVVSSFFNQQVTTPLGTGTAFGLFHLKETGQESIGQRVVVRLPVDETTRPHLTRENCMTPRATASAVFTFAVEEVEA